jgi:gas vesicle protein
MAYHLIPFVAGAVVGGLAVYLFRDEQVRDDLRQSATSISRKVQQTAAEVSGKVSRGLSQARESIPGRGQGAEPAAEPPAEAAPAEPRKPARRTAARKTATRKAPVEPPKADET